MAKDDREARLAVQLRANLQRRKAQQRAASPSPDDADQCASASEPIDSAAPAAS